MPDSVPESTIDRIIEASTIESTKLGFKTTIVHATLPNGFEVVTTSACNNPGDYDAEIGREIAMRRLKDKVWELAGFEAHGPLIDA